jgi:hypothetical protein
VAIPIGSLPLRALGQFAITESKRVMEHPAGTGGMPQAAGIATRFDAWLAKHADMPGASFLSSMVPYVVKTFKFEPHSCTSSSALSYQFVGNVGW